MTRSPLRYSLEDGSGLRQALVARAADGSECFRLRVPRKYELQSVLPLSDEQAVVVLSHRPDAVLRRGRALLYELISDVPWSDSTELLALRIDAARGRIRQQRTATVRTGRRPLPPFCGVDEHTAYAQSDQDPGDIAAGEAPCFVHELDLDALTITTLDDSLWAAPRSLRALSGCAVWYDRAHKAFVDVRPGQRRPRTLLRTEDVELAKDGSLARVELVGTQLRWQGRSGACSLWLDGVTRPDRILYWAPNMGPTSQMPDLPAELRWRGPPFWLLANLLPAVAHRDLDPPGSPSPRPSSRLEPSPCRACAAGLAFVTEYRFLNGLPENADFEMDWLWRCCSCGALHLSDMPRGPIALCNPPNPLDFGRQVIPLEPCSVCGRTFVGRGYVENGMTHNSCEHHEFVAPCSLLDAPVIRRFRAALLRPDAPTGAARRARAEELAGELMRRLGPWGASRSVRITWVSGEPAELHRLVPPAALRPGAQFGLDGALDRALLVQGSAAYAFAARVALEAHALLRRDSAAVELFAQDLFAAARWRTAASMGVCLGDTEPTPRGVAGRPVSEQEDPFEPLLSLWGTGYALLAIGADHVVLFSPSGAEQTRG